MSDRTYTWFAIPLRVLATPEVRAETCRIFDIHPEILAQELAGDPQPDEAMGQDDLAVRLVDGVACLVWEDVEADRGGAEYEAELIQAGIPYLQRNLAGEEYGPGRAAGIGIRHAWIRCDSAGEPIAGIGMVVGQAVVHVEELLDLELYTALRAEVLGLRG